jgi:hypothetical protein
MFNTEMPQMLAPPIARRPMRASTGAMTGLPRLGCARGVTGTCAIGPDAVG